MRHMDKMVGSGNTFGVFFERFKMSLKQAFEYKANFYAMILFDFVLFFTSMFFYSVFLGDVGKDILDWGNNEFVLLFCFGLLSGKFLWFFNLFEFSERLLSGELNLYLVRPINSFFMASLKFMSGHNIISGAILLIFTVFWLIFKDFHNLFFVILLMFIGWIFFSLLYLFADSFAFVFKNVEFVRVPLTRMNSILQFHTIAFFEKTSFVKVLAMFPCVLYSYIPIEVARGNFSVLYYYGPSILISMFCLVVGIFLLWKFGLKNYEGYN